MLKTLLSALLITFLVGCASIPQVTLLEGANNVRVGKMDALDSFQDIGPISVEDGEGCGGFGYQGTYDRAMTLLKNKAFKMGADYVQIFTVSEPYSATSSCFVNLYKISGTAYKKK